MLSMKLKTFLVMVIITMLLSSLFLDITYAARPSQRSVLRPRRSRRGNKVDQQTILNQQKQAAKDLSEAEATVEVPTNHTAHIYAPEKSDKTKKFQSDTILTGAWGFGEKVDNKTELWAQQSSIAQAIGVDMISTISIPMTLYVMPVGYDGDGHLGLTIPEPVWKHWSAGISISRPEKLTHGPKMPIYNSQSGNNAQITENDRKLDHDFVADVIYDLNVDILPCIREISTSILYVYRTLHRFEIAGQHSGFIYGRESSPHLYVEPQLLTRLLQTLYASAGEFIESLRSAYTLTIMNPKRDWIIESLTLNDQLDKVLYGLLKGKSVDTTQAQVNDDEKVHLQNYMFPPFHGFRHGLSLTEMYATDKFNVGDWSQNVLQLIQSEIKRIDERLDVESIHIEKEALNYTSPWQSMSLFDYLDEKIMLFAKKSDSAAENNRAAPSGDKLESIFGRDFKQSPTVWLDRLEEALDSIINNPFEVVLDTLAAQPSYEQEEQQKAKSPSNWDEDSNDQKPTAKRRGRRDSKRSGGFLDPLRPKSRRSGQRIDPTQPNTPSVSQKRRSANKEAAKLVGSLTVSQKQQEEKLHDSRARAANANNSENMTTNYFTQLSPKQHAQYKELLGTWSARVKKIFKQFGVYLSGLNKNSSGGDVKDNINHSNVSHDDIGTIDENDLWLQGLPPSYHVTLMSHLFPSQIAFQSYQVSNELGLASLMKEKQIRHSQPGVTDEQVAEQMSPIMLTSQFYQHQTSLLPPTYRQSCLTEAHVGTNRTAILDLTAGPFQWGGGFTHSGGYGTSRPIHNAGSAGFKTHTALPNADMLATIRYQTDSTQPLEPQNTRDDLIMKYYDIHGLKNIKLDLDQLLRKDDKHMASGEAPKRAGVGQADVVKEHSDSSAISRMTLQYIKDSRLKERVDQMKQERLQHEARVVATRNHSKTEDEDESFVDNEYDSDFDLPQPIFEDESSLSLENDSFDHLLDLPEGAMFHTIEEGEDDRVINKNGISSTPSSSAEVGPFLAELNVTSVEQSEFVLSRIPHVRLKNGKPQLRSLRSRQRERQASSAGIDGAPADLEAQARASGLFDGSLKDVLKHGHFASNAEIKERLEEERVDPPVTKDGEYATASNSNPHHDPPELVKQNGMFPSAEKIQEMLQKIAADERMDPEILLEKKAPGPKTKRASKDKELKKKETQDALQHEVVQQLYDTLLKEEKETHAQKETLGDDTVLKGAESVLNEDQIREAINTRQERRRNRRSRRGPDGKRVRPQYDADGKIISPPAIDPKTGEPTTKDPVPENIVIDENKVNTAPNLQQTVEKVRNELLLLEQLLESDMCKQGLLNCERYRDEYLSLKRVYTREMLNEANHLGNATKVDDDASINLDSTAPGTVDEEELKNRVLKDIDTPLSLQDGNHEITANDLDELLEKAGLGKNSAGHASAAAPRYDSEDKKDLEVDVNIEATTDAAVGINTLHTYDRLQAILNAMPATPGQTKQQQANALNFGHEGVNGGFSLAAVDYYMAHVNSAVNNYIDNTILAPMELTGVDKLYYRRVHFTLFLLYDHNDFNPLDLYNIPYVNFKDNNQYVYGPNSQYAKPREPIIPHTNNNAQGVGQNSKSEFVNKYNINMWHVLQLAIEQVRIRGQQFTYSIVPINIDLDPLLSIALQQSMATAISPSAYSSPHRPMAYTHNYINTAEFLKLIGDQLSIHTTPLPKNTRHIPIIMLSLATKQQPVLLDIHFQSVVRDGIVFAIQTPHTPTSMAVLDNNFGRSPNALIQGYVPHSPECNQGGYKLYLDPRDPTSAIFHSAISLLFSIHPPKYGLFVQPTVSPLSLSVPRVTLDAYQRSYLLTAMRTATKITNQATHTLSTIDSDISNACVLDEVYGPNDATYRFPFVKEWQDKKLYKLVRKAQRSVRFHLFVMREYIAALDIEVGVKYIRTLVGAAWQYRHLTELLLQRMDKCSYYSAFAKRKKGGLDLTDPKTYGLSEGSGLAQYLSGLFSSSTDPSDTNKMNGYDNQAPSVTNTQTNTFKSSYNVHKESKTRGVGIYVWIGVIAFCIFIFIFRVVNDVTVTVQAAKKDD